MLGARVLALLLLLAAPLAAQTPRVLTPADFTPAGAWSLPLTVDGLSTLYTGAGFALRRVNGELRWFIGISGEIVEFRPGVDGGLVFVRRYGKLWTAPESEPTQGLTGLYFHQTAPDGSGQLWMLHAYFYHVSGGDDPHLSMAEFAGDTLVRSVGPLQTTASYNKTRSAITGWLGGRLLIGAGGHFAGVSSASLGLFAGSFQPIPSTAIPATIHVDHPYDPGLWRTSMARMGDYSSVGLPTSPDGGTWPQPVDGVGKWQYYDNLDTFVFIDTGTARGLLTIGPEATGVIQYTPGGGSPGTLWKLAWRLFDPAAVDASQGGQVAPASYWRITPGWGDPDYGRVVDSNNDGMNTPLHTGAAFDRETSTLYVFTSKLRKLAASGAEYERLPGVVSFRVTPAPVVTPPPPPTIRCTVVSVLAPYADKDAKLTVRCDTNGKTPIGKGAVLEVKQ